MPVSAADKLIALTFDDGPGLYTEGLLDALAKQKVKVTFFLVGSCVEKYPDTVKREYKEGHELANHTWSHAKLAELDQEQFVSELNRTEDAIDRAVGKDVGKLLFRPTYGALTAAEKSYAERPIVMWSVDTLDWKYRDPEIVRENIVSSAEEGAIILVHDIHETSVEGVIAAVDELKKEGYTFVTVSELFRRKGIEMEDGRTYTNAPADGVDLGPIKSDPYAYDEDNLPDHWAYAYIQYVREHELMNGISKEKFGPNYPITRAMFIAALYRMADNMNYPEGFPAGKKGSKLMLSPEEIDGKTVFKDVKTGAWYAKAVDWGTEAGIVKGTSAKAFSPDAEVTREQAAVMLANFLAYTGFYIPEADETAYADDKDIHAWAKNAVAFVSAKRLMSGVNDTDFDPRETATRAQAAVMLTRLDKINRLRTESIFALSRINMSELMKTEKDGDKTVK